MTKQTELRQLSHHRDCGHRDIDVAERGETVLVGGPPRSEQPGTITVVPAHGERSIEFWHCPDCGEPLARCVLCQTAGHFVLVLTTARLEPWVWADVELCERCATAIVTYANRNSILVAAFHRELPLAPFVADEEAHGSWRWEQVSRAQVREPRHHD